MATRLVTTLLLLTLPVPALGQSASVGLYLDTNGTTCSFAGPGPGLVTAHVVFRPDARGFRAVRFAAPMPSCFAGIWIQDMPAEGMQVIGDSQTGISVASSSCEMTAAHILTILYYDTGSTLACCQFPLVADPQVQMIEAIDCNQDSFAASGSTAFMNADASCACNANVAPIAPFNPAPAENQTGISVFTTLSWSAVDPDNNLATFDLYLGANPNPPLYAGGLTEPFLQVVQPLAELTTFWWRVVARDGQGLETSSPVWRFTTRVFNSPPDEPNNPSPSNGALVQGVGLYLSWESGDADGERLLYDLYFGTINPPPLFMAGLVTPDFRQSAWDDLLTWNTHYYWRVLGRDTRGGRTSGPTWEFSTGPQHPVAVLFTRFDATAGGEGIRVRWRLESSEGLDRFALYRREGGATAMTVISSGALNAFDGEYMDRAVVNAAAYHYELVVRSAEGGEFRSPVATAATSVLALVLHQNVPNPFNPQTAIRYDLPDAGRVRLTIFDSSGRRIRTLVDEDQASGSREAIWNGRDDAGNTVSSGVYFYVLDAGKERLTRKLVLLK